MSLHLTRDERDRIAADGRGVLFREGICGLCIEGGMEAHDYTGRPHVEDVPPLEFVEAQACECQPPTTACIEWDGGRNQDGYGMKYVNAPDRPNRSRVVMAHRWTWEQENGPIPEGMIVMHRCDNPPCVRVDHLRLGTKAENNKDKVRKGRTAHGERSGRSKLSHEQVTEIRSSPYPAADLAAQYGVHWSTIYKIRSGETWTGPSGCEKCIGGKRRIAAVVPCETCAGKRVVQTYDGDLGHLTQPCPDCQSVPGEYEWSGATGFVTVGHVVVTWGPLMVIGFGVDDGLGYDADYVRLSDGTKVTPPPDIDPQSLIGQYAIGVEVAP